MYRKFDNILLEQFSRSGLFPEVCPIRAGKRGELMLINVLFISKSSLTSATEYLNKNYNEIIRESCYKDSRVQPYYGAVALGFFVHVVVYLIRKFKESDLKFDQELLGRIFDSVDQVFLTSSNCSILKNPFNKVSVYNTNLLMLSGMYALTKELEPNSQRCSYISSIFLRSSLKAVSDRSFFSPYYYHDLSFDKPHNYNMMVSSILFSFSSSFGINTSRLISQQSLAAYRVSDQFFDGLNFDWDRIEECDKKGSVWISAWKYCFCSDDKRESLTRDFLQQESKNFLFDKINKVEDPFFTAWFLLAILVQENGLLAFTDQNYREMRPYYLLGKFFFICSRLFRLVYRCPLFIGVKTYNLGRLILDLGPLENKK